eukprot:TRINITY_DN46282_c0_g1_i1.p1 TRINITY_DN46282_c0_g1~~TRINITY_DN46282_c0_g1_i1.p1  ORF type:complete len:183 (+),score=17.51 TRINITY_DN46282_c0_g1_i1:227-775(+)
MRDFFGRPRYHCGAAGCSCREFRPLSLRILEEEGEEVLRSRSISCQAKSEVALKCGSCDHVAHEHSGRPTLGVLQEGPPAKYRSVKGVCFRKPAFDPSERTVAKLTKLPADLCVTCTGLTWLAPQGGLWAELDDSQQWPRLCGGGWILVRPIDDSYEVFGFREALLVEVGEESEPQGTERAA